MNRKNRNKLWYFVVKVDMVLILWKFVLLHRFFRVTLKF